LRDARKGARNLRSLRLSNLRLVHADGTGGLPEAAPFDGHHRRGGGARIPARFAAACAGWQKIVPVGSGDQALCLVERTPTD